MVVQGRANGIGRLVPQDGIERLGRGRKRCRLRVCPVVQGDVDGPEDPEYGPRISSLDLGKLLIVRHERDLIPQCTEPILKLRQGPRDVKGARDTKSVSDQSVQAE